MPYVDVKDIGKVYIYLMSGNDPVCYYVADIEKFTNPNPEFQWIEMIPDLALGKVKEAHKAGVISSSSLFMTRPRMVKLTSRGTSHGPLRPRRTVLVSRSCG